MPLITVLTPTYNRAKLLPRLYESLCRQTCKNFEWIIVDDGSDDNTEDLIKRKIILCNQFNINYYKKRNGGKHTAINYGIKKAIGDLTFIADSDDILPNDAIFNIIKEWEKIKDKKGYAGICGLDGYFNGVIIGTTLPEKRMDLYYREAEFQYELKGDKKEVYKTSVLNEFPFPEIKGERFCPEDLVWNRISSKYKLRYIKKIIYLVEYQSNGLTSNIIKVRMKSPIASMMTYQEMTKYRDVPYKYKFKSAINYWRFRFCLSSKRRYKRKEIPKLNVYWNVFAPLGLVMHIKDNFSLKY